MPGNVTILLNKKIQKCQQETKAILTVLIKLQNSKTILKTLSK